VLARAKIPIGRPSRTTIGRRWSAEGDLFGPMAAGRFNVLVAMHWLGNRRVDENGGLETRP
jgi:hypothetical protein